MTYKNHINIAAVTLLAFGLVLSACGSSKNSNNTPSNGGSAGSSMKKKDGGTDGGGGSSSTKDSGPASKDAGPKDSGPAKADSGGGGSTGACAKDSAKDCYTCDAPTMDVEFLNHCT